MYNRATFTRGRPNIWSAIYWVSYAADQKKGHLCIAFTRGRSVEFMTCAMRETLPSNQSDRSANVTNWPVNGKDVK